MLRKFGKICSFRQFCNSTAKGPVLELLDRTVIRVSGEDVTDYLQGLITNDINHLSKSPTGALYAMLLNTKGRVLYDTIVYKTSDKVYLIECEKQVVEPVARHLKMYKVRRKINIDNLQDEYNVYALINHGTSLESNIGVNDMHVFKDPRIQELGYRIVAENSVTVKDSISKLSTSTILEQKGSYKYLRYSLGVGEGIQDHPPGNSFPLECNCDYLHGISFHKGCYIGQELTARTHHTGVVRKRLMPLYFSKLPTDKPKDDAIIHESTNLGKLRGIEGDVGLGLLRIDQTLKHEHITVADGLAKVKKPHWWPIEAVKNKASLQR
ncbi:unnamed protein product [Callosobruchus maculatus]|uniref:Uncharacterized protein n=1 Tax=Callosobruchus maculatus TaxID=64391 RepID=A0A653CPU2_CALMS|nr:unnamed protein product [Callosobruchus maculatus]